MRWEGHVRRKTIMKKPACKLLQTCAVDLPRFAYLLI